MVAGGYLGDLGLEVADLGLQVAFLAQRGGERGVLGVHQRLQVLQPQQGRGQVRLLLGVPAGKQRRGG